MEEAEGRCTALPMEPGLALFFDSLLPNGTPSNDSPHRRPALQYHDAQDDAVKWDERQRLALFGSEDEGHHVLT